MPLVTMTFLTTALGLALCFLWTSAEEILPQQNFENKMMEGKWYMIAIATNYQRYIETNYTMCIIIASMEEDGLEFFDKRQHADGSCFRNNNSLKNTDEPGKFTFIENNTNNTIIMVSVKKDLYALVHLLRTIEGVPITVEVIVLYVRELKTYQEKEAKFRRYAEKVGVHPENVLYFDINTSNKCLTD